MTTLRTSLLIAVLAAVPMLVSAESMRCGKWVVDERAEAAELLKKCGDPIEKTSKTEDVFAVNAAGLRYKVGVSTREEWFYQRSAQSLRMVVLVVDGRVRSIERAD